MNDETEEQFEKLKLANEDLRKRIQALLNRFMMSDDIEDVMVLVNELIENELQQEETWDRHNRG